MNGEKRLLDRVLDGDDTVLAEPEGMQGTTATNEVQSSNQMRLGSMAAGNQNVLCVECGDQPGQTQCLQCEEIFCEVCFFALHRTGTRKNHQTISLKKEPENGGHKRKGEEADMAVDHPGQSVKAKEVKEDESQYEEDSDEEMKTGNSYSSIPQNPTASVGTYFLERSKYIPIRLDLHERKLLRLLEASLNVSEYTDKVDILSFNSSKSKRIHTQLRDICAILCGLVVATDYARGQQLIQDRSFAENSKFFQEVFEVGRRHKIMNPEKMRTDYGKLIYLLQDSQIPDIQNLLQFDMISPVKTVYRMLEAAGALAVLQDPNIAWATKEITPEGKTRGEIQMDIKQKERAIEILAKKYANQEIAPETIRVCLYSIGDNHSFLRTSRDNIDKMITYLKRYFTPGAPEDDDYSLAIQFGVGGARLSHNHSRQYAYALQTMTLWREISHDMFKLWILAEEDLLDSQSYYSLRDTGQGLNRVQQAPRIAREMHTILYRTQKDLGDWVGSSVIHLGDHNVPNAFMFIDKYTQVPRILNPIVSTLGKIDDLIKDPHMKLYVDKAFGGKENLKKEILTDFFRHAFDGSGADNFFDAGSCVDGRLTSAWNWCSKIEKKRYFPVFLLTDFIGFDGKF